MKCPVQGTTLLVTQQSTKMLSQSSESSRIFPGFANHIASISGNFRPKGSALQHGVK
jgi:hypothetical protein